MVSSQSSAHGAIEAVGLVKRYPGDVLALDGLSFGRSRRGARR